MASRTTNHRIVGPVQWRARPDRTIEILNGWDDQNIAVVHVPQLKGVPTFGPGDTTRPFSGNVPFYKGAEDQLKAAWQEVAAHGLMDRVLFWGGSFVPRMIRGSKTTPSEHTFGCAFDINHQQNGLGVTPPPAGKKGSVRELVPFFERHGFFWGGNFSRRDGMHFQVETLGEAPGGEAFPSVEIFVDNFQEVVPALLIEGKTWIGARALAKRLSGKIEEAGGEPFTITMILKNTRKQYEAKRVGEVGYVAFSDVMPLYNLPFTFDSDRRRVDITTR